MNFLSQELKIRFFGLDLRVYTLRDMVGTSGSNLARN